MPIKSEYSDPMEMDSNAMDADDAQADGKDAAEPPTKRTRRDTDFLRKEKSLGEFLVEMDKYAPLVGGRSPKRIRNPPDI